MIPLEFLPLIGFGLGAVLGVLGSFGAGQRLSTVLFLLYPALCSFFLLSNRVVTTGRISQFEPLGFSASFALTPWGELFSLLIAGIGTLVFIYSASYFKGDKRRPRVFAWLTVFMAAMLGVVVSDDLILLFIFWEMTSVSSYFLIGLDHESPAARRSALQALLVTGVGGLTLLIGALLVGNVAGTTSLSALSALPADNLAVTVAAVCFVIVGLTKSAQFPFHFWLPGAMAAPSPISAYLHSATMVKAGVFLLAVVTPLFIHLPWWGPTLITLGAITLVLGGVSMLRERDMKLMLAHSTLSALGSLTVLVGIGTPLSILALVVFLVSHALYKAALFLAVGAVDHETGTRSYLELRGLRRQLPLTCIAVSIAVLSLIGLPPVLGFLAKELLIEAALSVGTMLTVAVVIGSALVGAGGFIILIRPWWGESSHPTVHEAPTALWAPPLVLGLVGIGVIASLGSLTELFHTVAASLTAPTASFPKLTLWHGITPALMVSSVIVLLAGCGFLYRERLFNLFARIPRCAELLFDLTYNGILSSAEYCTNRFQNGSLRRYLHYLFFTFLLSSLSILWWEGVPAVTSSFTWPFVHEILLGLIVISGVIGACAARSIFGSISALGLVGAGVAIFFATLGAPDLAITQFVVETLTIVMLVLLVRCLPDFSERSSRLAECRDITIALTVGAIVTLFCLAALTPLSSSALSEFFLTNSLTKAYGQNVVNVILVDFRALDTLGEITVLGIAGLGVFGLVKLRMGSGVKQ